MSATHSVPTGLKGSVRVAFRLQTCRSYGAKIRVSCHFSKSFRSSDDDNMQGARRGRKAGRPAPPAQIPA